MTGGQMGSALWRPRQANRASAGAGCAAGISSRKAVCLLRSVVRFTASGRRKKRWKVRSVSWTNARVAGSDGSPPQQGRRYVRDDLRFSSAVVHEVQLLPRPHAQDVESLTRRCAGGVFGIAVQIWNEDDIEFETFHAHGVHDVDSVCGEINCRPISVARYVRLDRGLETLTRELTMDFTLKFNGSADDSYSALGATGNILGELYYEWPPRGAVHQVWDIAGSLGEVDVHEVIAHSKMFRQEGDLARSAVIIPQQNSLCLHLEFLADVGKCRLILLETSESVRENSDMIFEDAAEFVELMWQVLSIVDDQVARKFWLALKALNLHPGPVVTPFIRTVCWRFVLEIFFQNSCSQR